MILYLFGSDTFRSRQYLHQSVEQFKKQRDPHGYNVVFLDGKKETAEKIFAEINTAPFLAEKRMIVIENILSNNDKDLLGGMIERIQTKRMPEDNVIIFWQGEALSKVKEAKELQVLLGKEKFALEFKQLADRELFGWAQKEVEQRGGKIEREALEYLCEHAGKDMWRLNTLIDQLVAYASSRSILLADVQLFLEEKLDDNIFSMVDAIVSGNQKLAFKLLNYQRELGEEDGKIFGLLVWQFRILLQMADALEREGNITSDALAKKLGIHPFVAKKNLPVVRRTSLAKLQEAQCRLLEIDVKTKTGQADQPLLIDLFVGAWT